MLMQFYILATGATEGEIKGGYRGVLILKKKESYTDDDSWKNVSTVPSEFESSTKSFKFFRGLTTDNGDFLTIAHTEILRFDPDYGTNPVGMGRWTKVDNLKYPRKEHAVSLVPMWTKDHCIAED